MLNRKQLRIVFYRALACAPLLCCINSAHAQLRIVSYNTLTAENPGVQTARPTAATVLEAIGLESVNGIAKPIDVMLLQEQFSAAVTTQSFVDVLNSIYGAGTYARSTLDAEASDRMYRRAGGPTMLYNTKTVSLIAEQRFGTVNGTNQARSAMRYQLRPVGYDASADFYAYSNHYKASDGTEDKRRRNVEAVAVRNNADALGEGAHLIFAGDFNIQSSSEAMYQTLLAAGAGQAHDPLNASGTPGSPVKWLDNNALRWLHTQNPAGPMDDRFDFQLVSGEMLDNEGMSIIPGSYRAFGNNGTHLLEGAITTGTGASPTVLNALRQNSDHLPVVADYQLPAKMGVEFAGVPEIVTMGASVSLGITISNVANVVAAIGADELDYTLSVAGDLFGGGTGIDFALGAGNTHQITLNTATLGMKSGVITVSSSSQGAANSLVTIPVSYQVIADFLAADFNEDGFVDAGDLATWKNNFGLATGATKQLGDANLDGTIDGSDFLLWQQQFSGAGATLAAAGVPEPTSVLLLCCGAFGIALRRRARASTR